MSVEQGHLSEQVADGTRGWQWHGGTYIRCGLFYNGHCVIPWPLAATWRYRRLRWWWPS